MTGLDNALSELEEELGLVCKKRSGQLFFYDKKGGCFLSQHDFLENTYFSSGAMIEENHIFYFSADKLPALKPKDSHEIAQAVWAKVDDILDNQYDGVKISEKENEWRYVDLLENAFVRIMESELHRQTDRLFSRFCNVTQMMALGIVQPKEKIGKEPKNILSRTRYYSTLITEAVSFYQLKKQDKKNQEQESNLKCCA